MSAIRLLQELGITEPSDIKIEAIAEHCGATIVYQPIRGSAARILGFGDRAFITVDSESRRERQRFSAGHELGHWMMDRGKVASFVCAERVFATEWVNDNPERRANRYSADLLLPPFMFEPLAKNREITFATVELLARQFQTSLTATAIRLIEFGSFPAMIICSELGRRKWFIPGPDIPSELRPRDAPGAYTCAYDLFHGKHKEESPTDVQADGWITHPHSRKYSIREHSKKISHNLVLTLLWWKDESQLLDIRDEED
ncbi:MAG TPA: ImmA/IrrE family metallo-endopeptidase [Pyrinomonadaceae bacterium]|nr:ImmA/IrrE family metallo-endopeptidase [Pyrinomonadaceae bacterium]